MKLEIHLEGDEEKLRKSAKFLEGALLELIHAPAHDDIEKRVIEPSIRGNQNYYLLGYYITDFDKDGKRIHASYVSVEDMMKRGEGFPIT